MCEKVKASCFVLVVDRTTSSLHRKNDLLAIAPNWELDHGQFNHSLSLILPSKSSPILSSLLFSVDSGVVRIIEMKSYKKKKTIIIRFQNDFRLSS